MALRTCSMFLIVAAAFVGGCSSQPSEPAPQPQADAAATAAPRSFQTRLLDLVPGREDDRAPSLDRIAAFLPECALERSAAGSEAGGACALSAEDGGARVGMRAHVTDDGVTGLRVSAAAHAFDPLARQSVLRTELLCPELTLVASDSAQVYRVSAPGKRDFVYIETRAAEDGEVSRTLLLRPFIATDECAAIAAEAQYFDGTAPQMTLPAGENASSFGLS